MTTPSAAEKGAKILGFLLWFAGFCLIFFVEPLRTWGGLCTGFGYFFSAVGFRKEAQRLRKEIESLTLRETVGVKEPV